MTALLDAVDARGLRERARHARHSWRVVWKVSALNLRARMAYRGDFVASIVFGILWQSSTLIFAGVLLTRFDGLAGFPSTGVLLIIGMRLLSHGFYVLVFGNIGALSFLVELGLVDGYFLRPFSVFRQVLLAQFNVNALGDILVGVTSFAFAVALADLQWTAGKAVYVGLAIVGGVLIEAAVRSSRWPACCCAHRPRGWSTSGSTS